MMKPVLWISASLLAASPILGCSGEKLPVVAGSSSAGTSSGSGSSGGGPLPPPGPPGCGLDQAAFCDTFDTPSPGGRGGDLDEKEWSVARINNAMNGSQGEFVSWPTTVAQACGTTTDGVVPDNDFFFCSGGPTPSMHLNNAYDDGAMFTIQSFRIRRPFDFSGRTGIIAFDAGAKSQIPGGHGWWFNVFIADQPVPIPYQEANAQALYARAGVGIEFEGGFNCENGGGDGVKNAVSNIFVEEDYAITHTYGWNDIQDLECFATQEEVMNHVEIHISETKIEVFVSDAGDPTTFRRVGWVDGIQVPFTRGYVSFQHTHYNAAKSGLPVSYTTYHFDNIGFDGPSFPTPRGYDVPDSLSTNANPATFAHSPPLNIGYNLGMNGIHEDQYDASPITPITFADVDLTGATDAVLTLNASAFLDGDHIDYRFNTGTWRTFNHPFPTSDPGGRAVAIPVDLNDLKAGANALEIKSSSGIIIASNLDLTVNHE